MKKSHNGKIVPDIKQKKTDLLKTNLGDLIISIYESALLETRDPNIAEKITAEIIKDVVKKRYRTPPKKRNIATSSKLR